MLLLLLRWQHLQNAQGVFFHMSFQPVETSSGCVKGLPEDSWYHSVTAPFTCMQPT